MTVKELRKCLEEVVHEDATVFLYEQHGPDACEPSVFVGCVHHVEVENTSMFGSDGQRMCTGNSINIFGYRPVFPDRGVYPPQQTA
jgi:hypothetical protein